LLLAACGPNGQTKKNDFAMHLTRLRGTRSNKFCDDVSGTSSLGQNHYLTIVQYSHMESDSKREQKNKNDFSAPSLFQIQQQLFENKHKGLLK
jgi:hypothetical protein